MPKDGTTTKEKILSESKYLLLNKGFAGMSIDQILEKTGITKGAFFYHFKSKAELAQALIIRFAEEDMAEMKRAIEATEKYSDEPKERLLQFIQHFIDLFKSLDDSYPGCLYISYIYEQDSFEDNTIAIIKDTILIWRKTLVELIEAVMKEYSLVIETDKEALADYFNVVFEGAFVLDKAIDEKGFMVKQLKHMKTFYDLIFKK